MIFESDDPKLTQCEASLMTIADAARYLSPEDWTSRCNAISADCYSTLLASEPTLPNLQVLQNCQTSQGGAGSSNPPPPPPPPSTQAEVQSVLSQYNLCLSIDVSALQSVLLPICSAAGFPGQQAGLSNAINTASQDMKTCLQSLRSNAEAFTAICQILSPS